MENEIRKNGLTPIVNEDSTILILGSLPSDKSIKLNEYYASSNNQFWKIITSIFDKNEQDLKNYNEKLAFLHENHIALWDVYSSASRENSTDTNIKNGEYNNLKDFLSKYTNITKILLNGKASQTAFEKYMKRNDINYDYVYVPSTSGVNTKYTLNEKILYWKKKIFLK